MKSTSNLLTVVMDGIRDANMLYDYAEIADAEGNVDLNEWFMRKANDRVKRTIEEWGDAYKVMGLDTKSDDMSACLENHVNHEISALRARMK